MNKTPLTIELLEVLDAIDRRESFAKAAEELNKAPSAISYAIQKLEEQLDVTVFERQGRRSVFTAAGKVLLDEGRHILTATNRLADQAKQVATGLETQIHIGLESIYNQPYFFSVLEAFLRDFPTVEIDVCESVLNGGWEALEHDRVDLIVGVTGPVPRHKNFRAVVIGQEDLIPVIASSHPKSRYVFKDDAMSTLLPNIRKVITHDTSTMHVAKSAGLKGDGQIIYVQNMSQKKDAILAGIGVGHLPKKLIQHYLESGELMELPLAKKDKQNCYAAWKISNKGKGLKSLATRFTQL